MQVTTVKALEKERFEGMDASLEESIFTYGFIYRKIENRWEFIIQTVPSNDENDQEETFVSCILDEKDSDFHPDTCPDFFKDLSSFTGIDDYSNVDFPTIINDLVNYYGELNIFGDRAFIRELVILQD